MRHRPGLVFRRAAARHRLPRPRPIGSVQKVDVAAIRDLQVPDRGENLILTSDLNVINLGYTVRWNIRSPEMYLFQLEDPDKTVREVAESAMREAVARKTLDEALGAGRGDIETRVQQRMQEVLDHYSWIQIQTVSVSQSGPPAQVNAAFLQVSAANQQAQSAVNAARGYAQQVSALAQGEAAQFDRIYAQYRLAPDVTRRRMYYETMEAILQQTDTTVVEAPGVQTYLPLPQIRGRPTPAVPAPAGERADDPPPQEPDRARRSGHRAADPDRQHRLDRAGNEAGGDRALRSAGAGDQLLPAQCRLRPGRRGPCLPHPLRRADPLYRQARPLDRDGQPAGPLHRSAAA